MSEINILIPSLITYKFTDNQNTMHKFIIEKIKFQVSDIDLSTLNTYKKNKKNIKKYISILYKINYIRTNNTEEKTFKCYIPYYLSDGQTNHFRLNLLFPYICIVNQYSPNTCPRLLNSSQYSSGLLLKYGDVRNLNIKKIHTELTTMKEIEICDDIYVCNPDGINSVLPRLYNVLDFIIAISSYYIPNSYNINDDIKTYPNYRDTFDKFNIENDNYENNVNNFNKIHNIHNINKEYDEMYRSSLLKFFINAKQNCISNKFIDVRYEKINIDGEDIVRSIELINKFMKYGICNMDTNSTTEYAENNNNIYNYISYHMAKSLKSDNNFHFKNYILDQKKPPTLNEMIKKWKATCDNTENIKKASQ